MTGDHSAQTPPPGSVADEAARLVAALRSSRRAPGVGEAPGVDPPHDVGDTEQPTGATPPGPDDGCRCGGTEPLCALCPVCSGLRLLRAVRPETVEALADVLALGAQGLRDLAEQIRVPRPHDPQGAGGASSAGADNASSDPAAPTDAPDPSETAPFPPREHRA